MLRVALTGGIATGKSHVVSRLRAAGVPVVDADVLARQVVSVGSPGLAAVVQRFGTGVLAADGSLDRKKLADVVFRDSDARHELEAIIHPAVREAIETFFTALPPHVPFAVADIPLLYETGRDEDFDRVVVTACAPEAQLARVMARDGATREEAERRVAAQMPIEDKVRRADEVIRTDGSYEDTDRQIDDILGRLREAARNHS